MLSMVARRVTAIGPSVKFVARNTRLGMSIGRGATRPSARHLNAVFPSIAATDGDLHEPAAARSR
jgi:hypothetical protein